MKKLFSISAFLIIALISQAQSIQWLQAIHKIRSKEDVPVVLHSDKNSITTYSIINKDWSAGFIENDVIKGVRFDRFDIHTGELIDSKTHMYVDDNHVFVKLFVKDKEIIALNYYYSDSEKKYFTELYFFDFETFEFIDSKSLFNRNVPSAFFDRPIQFDISEDKKHILLIETKVTMNTIENITRLYNNNWGVQFANTLQYNNLIQMNKEGSLFYLKNTGIKDVYVVSRNIKNDFEQKEEKLNIPILGRGEELTHLTSNMNSNGDYIITGLYGHRKMYDYETVNSDYSNISLKGYIYIRLDHESKKIVESKKVSFKEHLNKIETVDDILMEFIADFSREQLVKDAYPTSDGGIIIFCEKEYNITKEDSEGKISAKFYYDNMMLIKVQKDGSLKWILPLQKNQQLDFHKQTNKYIFVNDNEAILFFESSSGKKIKTTTAYKNEIEDSGLNIYSIDLNSGKYSSKFPGYKSKSDNEIFYRSTYNNATMSQLILILNTKNKFQIGKFRINE